MMRKKIAIVSRREAVFKFFSTEAERCGFSCLRGTRYTKEMEGCEALIWDVESVELFDRSPQKLLMIAKRFSPILEVTEQEHVYCLSWPTSVYEADRFFEALHPETDPWISDSEPRRDTALEGETEVLFLGKESVLYRNRRILLSAKEHTLLEALGAVNGAIVERKELDRLLAVEKGNMSDVYICRLRQKLEKPFSVRLIETVRGSGYRLYARVLPVEESELSLEDL